MKLSNLNKFMNLSATMTYQLGAGENGLDNILDVILDDDELPDQQRELLIDTLKYLIHAYGTQTRRLGPLMVLHPLRAAALLARAKPKWLFLNILTELLHDKFEDIEESNYPPDVWQQLEKEFNELIQRIESETKWFLMQRLKWLTREKNELYYCYIGRLLDEAPETPEVVYEKLADRLDNTLDLRVVRRDPLSNINFYETVFQYLFISNTPEPGPPKKHPAASLLNGAYRLYQLFKNAVLLSLIRQKNVQTTDQAFNTLFQEVANASIQEAQRIIIHIFQYHSEKIGSKRQLILDAMEYCYSERIQTVTPQIQGQPLDGFFKGFFDHADPGERKKQLSALYENKLLMVEAGFAFIAIFQSFLINPAFYIRGINQNGLCEECKPLPKSE